MENLPKTKTIEERKSHHPTSMRAKKKYMCWFLIERKKVISPKRAR